MLQTSLIKKLSFVLGTALLSSCSIGAARGEDSAGPAPDPAPPVSSNPMSQPMGQASPQAPESTNHVWRDARYYLQSTWSSRNLLEGALVAGVPNLTAAPVQPQAPAIIDKTTAEAYTNAMDQYSAGMDEW